MGKYIIYTMGIKKLNEAAWEVLLDKGHEWGGMGGGASPPPRWVEAEYLVIEGKNVFWSIVCDKNNYREITFRELCELPPVDDEIEELATQIIKSIHAFWVENQPRAREPSFYLWAKQQNWRKIREKVEEELGL